jgi:hypothetical protein
VAVKILSLVFLLFCVSPSQRAAAFKALTSWSTYQQIPDAIQTGAYNFMTEAEATGVVFHYGEDGFVDDFAVRCYVGGYAAGFTTEQICVAAVGAGMAAKAGTAAKLVVGSTSAGAVVLEGVSATAKALERFKSLSVNLAINAAKKAARTEALAKEATRMADTVAKLPFGNGKTVGEIVVQYVDNLNVIAEELAAIGKPLDTFGVKVHEKLARLLEVDVGSSLTDAEMRGFVRVYACLEFGAGDVYDKLPLIFRTEAAAGRQRLRTALAAYADPASVPDKDLLTLVYAAKKEVDPAEHPALVAFKQRVEALKQPTGQVKYQEGFAGARYELDHPGTTLTRSTDEAWDFNTSGGLKLEMKGPITIKSATGEFLSSNIVEDNITQLAAAIAEELPTTPANWIVIDTFGLSVAQENILLDELAGYGVTDLSRIKFQ